MQFLKSLSKKILLLCSFALLLQPAAIQAAQQASFKQQAGALAGKVGSAFKGATSRAMDFVSTKAQQAFDRATKQVMSLDRARLFETVQNKMISAGNRVRKISTCMATGKECDVTDRVLLIGTASFIFVALMVLAGSSLGVAARAKIVEDAKKEQQQKVTGWGPREMAQRLSNMFADSQNKFRSLKAGIISGQLTKRQRNFLIGLGTSIIGATLVLAAALTAVAVYSVQQEEKQKSEIEQTTKSVMEMEGSLTPMQKYFTKDVIEKGTTAFQRSAESIKAFLQEKAIAAQQSSAAIMQEEKEKLAALAQEKLNAAQAVAQNFLWEVKSGGEQFYQNALEKIIGVKLQYIQPTLNRINEYSTRVSKAFAPLSNIRLMGQIQRLTDYINELIERASNLSGRWQEALSQLAQRAVWIKSHIRPTWAGGKSQEEINREADKEFPLAKTIDDIWKFYPTLVASINDLKLAGPGIIVNDALKVSSMLLGAFRSLNEASGKIGKTLISKELSDALAKTRRQLEQLGIVIRQTTAIKPILKIFPASTPSALLEALKGYGWRVGTNLHEQIMHQAQTIMDIYNNKITPSLEHITRKQADLSQRALSIPQNIKRQFVDKLEQEPIKVTATAPYQLAVILGKEVTSIKKSVSDMIQDISTLLMDVIDLIVQSPKMLNLINQATDGEFVNQDILEGLNLIGFTVKAIRSKLVGIEQGVQKSLPMVPAVAK